MLPNIFPQLPHSNSPCSTPKCLSSILSPPLALIYTQLSLRKSFSSTHPDIHPTVDPKFPLSHSNCTPKFRSTNPSQPLALYIQISLQSSVILSQFISVFSSKILSATRPLYPKTISKLLLRQTPFRKLNCFTKFPLSHSPFTFKYRSTIPSQTLALLYIQMILQQFLTHTRPVQQNITPQIPHSHSPCTSNCPSTTPSQALALYESLRKSRKSHTVCWIEVPVSVFKYILS